MERASEFERFYQCLTCKYTKRCKLDDDAEDERGLCKGYCMDVKIARDFADIGVVKKGD